MDRSDAARSTSLTRVSRHASSEASAPFASLGTQLEARLLLWDGLVQSRLSDGQVTLGAKRDEVLWTVDSGEALDQLLEEVPGTRDIALTLQDEGQHIHARQ